MMFTCKVTKKEVSRKEDDWLSDTVSKEWLSLLGSTAKMGLKEYGKRSNKLGKLQSKMNPQQWGWYMEKIGHVYGEAQP